MNADIRAFYPTPRPPARTQGGGENAGRERVFCSLDPFLGKGLGIGVNRLNLLNCIISPDFV